MKVPRSRRPVAEWARLVLLITLSLQVCLVKGWFVGDELGRAYRSNVAGDGPRRAGSRLIRPDLPGHRNLGEGTISQRDRALADYALWLQGIPGAPPVPLLVQDVEELNTSLEAYGRSLFRHGRSRGEFVNLILGIVDARRLLRRQLSAAWDFVALWKSRYPGGNRIALPEELVRAMTTVSLYWGWVRFAATLRLGFYALLRPGEIANATRRGIVLPEDLCRSPLEDWRVYVHVGSPKTKGAGARQQHGRSEDPATCCLARRVLSRVSDDGGVWGGSSTLFRARWNAVCRALDIPFHEVSGVTPASMRGGGATTLFEATNNIEEVRYRGRWSSANMCEIYVQEVGGHKFLAGLPPATRARILHWASWEHAAIDRAISLLDAGTDTSLFPHYFK